MRLPNHFNDLLIRKGRENYLPEIADAFIEQYKEYKGIVTVTLTTAIPVSEEVKNVFISKLKREANMKEVELICLVNENIIGGFILEGNGRRIDASVAYDLTKIKNRFLNKRIHIPVPLINTEDQFKNKYMAEIKPDEISAIIRQQLSNFNVTTEMEEVGTVLQVGDGIARVYGLNNVGSGELVEFENGIRAIALNLEEDNVGIVLMGDTGEIKEGAKVRRTGKIASIKVYESMLGRVVNTLGETIDGKGPLTGESYEMPMERKAPGVIFREPVKEPLQTGIKAIDAMIPIGRGQRELIIGDRQTGKTAIAIDTIINQKEFYKAGKPVYCIYVAIGQKASTVAGIMQTLNESGAMAYTVIVAASASDPAPLQFYAPFAGAAIGEYFRDTGRPALIIYDDLSKQAVAYREVSLVASPPTGT